MNDGRQRPSVGQDLHPLQTQLYWFETPVIKDLSANVVRWVKNRSPGGLIFGESGMGKSRFIHILELKLKATFPKTTVLSIDTDWTSAPSEKQFYLMLLENVSLTTHRSTTIADRLTLFTNDLISRTHRGGKVILIIDEAQNLSYGHFQALISIHNRLARAGIALIAILVGLKKLLSIRASYQQTGEPEIVRRFMVEDAVFHGIRSSEEIAFFLRSYDEKSDFPPGSGWSFTRFFLPEWFEKKGRLQPYADRIWGLIEKARFENKTRALPEFPMVYLTLTVENFFRFSSPHFSDTKLMPLDTEEDCARCLEKAFEQSGYARALANWARPSGEDKKDQNDRRP